MADQTTKPANLPRLSEPGTNRLADGPTQGQPDIPPNSLAVSALMNFAFNKFSRWIQFLDYRASNHVHDGGATDLSAPKVDLNVGVSTGADGIVNYSTSGTAFELKAAPLGSALTSDIRANEIVSDAKVFSIGGAGKFARTTMWKIGQRILLEDSGYVVGDVVYRVTNFLQVQHSKVDDDYSQKNNTKGLYSGENMFAAYGRYRLATAGGVNSSTKLSARGWKLADEPDGSFSITGILSIDISKIVNQNSNKIIAQIHSNEAASSVYVVDAWIVGTTTAKFDIRKLSAAAEPLNIFQSGATVNGTSLDLTFFIV